jgi:hypothetical protein
LYWKPHFDEYKETNMKRGKIVSKAALLIVLVYPILFSGCGLLFLAIVHGTEAAESAAEEKNKKIVDVREKDLVITKTDKGVVIKRYRGKNKNIRLPSEIQGMPVIEISDEAFAKKGLIGVIIPDSVTTIGDDAFISNQLASVTIPNSVTEIGQSAFRENNLASVTIPNSLTVIGPRAFENNRLTSVTIPDNVTRIGEGAFAGNRLTSVSVFNATRVGKGAFGEARIRVRPDSDFEVKPDPKGGVMITKYLGSEQELTIPPKIQNLAVTGIGKSAFKNKRLTSVTIPNSVTRIREGAFKSNRLTSVTIPSNVTAIGANAFDSNNLTSVTISNGVTTIGDCAFFVNDIASVTIPNSVKIIGFDAFANIFAFDQFTSITIPSNVVVSYSKSHFFRFYNQNNKVGGTYRKDANGNWRKE